MGHRAMAVVMNLNAQLLFHYWRVYEIKFN